MRLYTVVGLELFGYWDQLPSFRLGSKDSRWFEETGKAIKPPVALVSRPFAKRPLEHIDLLLCKPVLEMPKLRGPHASLHSRNRSKWGNPAPRWPHQKKPTEISNRKFENSSHTLNLPEHINNLLALFSRLARRTGTRQVLPLAVALGT